MAKLKIGNAESEVSAINFDGAVNNAVLDFGKPEDKTLYISKIEFEKAAGSGFYLLTATINEFVAGQPKTATVDDQNLGDIADGTKLLTGAVTITGESLAYTGSVQLDNGDIAVDTISSYKRLCFKINDESKYLNQVGGQKLTAKGNNIVTTEAFATAQGTLSQATEDHFTTFRKAVQLDKNRND